MKIKSVSRTFAKLVDKDGNTVKQVVVPKSMNACAKYLGINVNLDSGDKIILEEEGK